MAIPGSFNLSQATTSQAYAYKCWYNYNYGGNTMGISAKDMGEITQTWNSELTKWRATAKTSQDENKYEIDDDDFNTAKNNAKNTIKDETGYNGKKGKMATRAAADVAAGAVGALAATIGKKTATKAATWVANKVVKKVTEEVTSEIVKKAAATATKKVAGTAVKQAATEAATKAATAAATEAGKKAAEAGVANFVGKAAEKAAAKAAAKAAEKGTEKAAEKGAEAAAKVTKAGKNIGWIITAPLALATGTAYTAKKPNKTEKEACDELQNSMTDSQAALASAQGDMETYASEVEELSDEAAAQNEDANDSIEEDKTEFDMYKASYEALIEKMQSGEALTEEEKNLLNELIPLLQELGVNIQKTSDEATDTVSSLYDEIGTYQDGYDEAASTMAEVEGVTNYAEGFDEATRIMCYVEGASQGLNAASGAQAAYQAGAFAASGGIFTAWAWAFAAMGAAGAAMSGVGTAQQIKWAGDVGTEIDMRKETQNLNVDTQGVYDENIDVYAGQLENVEGLELEIPDDLEVPETPEIPTGENGTPVTTSSANPFVQPVTQSVNNAPAANGATTGNNTSANTTDADDQNGNKKKKDKEV